jgi:hypothetical protein
MVVREGSASSSLVSIVAYARKHTDTHLTMFVIARNNLRTGPKEKVMFYIMKRLVGFKALTQGAIPAVVAVF